MRRRATWNASVRPSHPRELEDSHHRIVGFLWARTGKALPYAMRSDRESVQIKGRYVLAVDDGNAYLAAGLAGLGVLWLPDYMSKTYEARGELVPPVRGLAPRSDADLRGISAEPACQHQVARIHRLGR